MQPESLTEWGAGRPQERTRREDKDRGVENRSDSRSKEKSLLESTVEVVNTWEGDLARILEEKSRVIISLQVVSGTET